MSDFPFDFFDNLFEDCPCETPKKNSFSITKSSPPQSHAHSEDESSDSGHGSPGSSCFRNCSRSPDLIDTWESNIDNSIWGSILDDLPDEFSDTEVYDYSTNLKYSLIDEKSLMWENSKDIYNEEDYSMTMNTTEILNNTENVQQISVTNNPVEINSSKLVPNAPNDSGQKSDQSLPFILKLVNSNCLQNENIKSHIKIGKNIFAVMQNSNQVKTVHAPIIASSIQKPVNISSNVSSFQSPVGLSKNINSTEEQLGIFSVEKKSVNVKEKEMRKHTKIEDHDYFEEADLDVNGTTGVSLGSGPGLALTDEEKRLLELENVILPENCGLTKDEEKVLKKVRRKIKNKQSAMESRRRRKEYIDSLEKRVKNCTDINLTLKKKVDSLTEDNKSLLKQLKELQSFVAASVQQSRNTQKGTCLAMLVLSFAFFFLPFNHMAVNAPKNSILTEAPSQADVFRSRTLLHLENQSDIDVYEYDAAMSRFDTHNRTHATTYPKVFSDEVRTKIEQLLAAEDSTSNLLKATLDVYMNSIEYPQNVELKKLDLVNVLEFQQDDVPSNWRKKGNSGDVML